MNNMTNQEIIDNNKLIAIFMNNYQKLSNDPEFGKFHLSWDWLMPVVHKIGIMPFSENPGLREYIVENLRYDFHLYMPIEDIYKKVVKFIKWYNENIKT